MDIARRIQDGWGLGPVLEVRNLGGSGVCRLVVTGQGSFVYKQVGRPDFVAVCDRVQKILNVNGLVQALLVPAKDGQLMQPDGFSLFEYIPGDAPMEYTDDQFASAINYLRKYNEALRLVPFDPAEVLRLNVWDEVRSTEYLCSQVESLIIQAELEAPTQSLVRRAACLLRDGCDRLSCLPKQLIHGDPGPGNLIFDGSEVRTIIDFTPDYENEMYSLAQFLYWTCLWRFEQPRSHDRIEEALRMYPKPTGVHSQDRKDAMFAHLLKACMFRIMGPALSMLRSGTLKPERISRRLSALERLLDIQTPQD